jgi:hypothetical protein
LPKLLAKNAILKSENGQAENFSLSSSHSGNRSSSIPRKSSLNNPETPLNPLSTMPTKTAWWVEINTSAPQKTHYLGLFDSREEAKFSRGAHVESLYRKGSDIVALIKQRWPYKSLNWRIDVEPSATPRVTSH